MTRTFSPSVARMIDDAVAAGFEFSSKNEEHFLTKSDRWGNYRLGSVRFALTETGAFAFAHRLDVRVDLALNVRTIRTTREILGI
jgi:hypothetical protein